ncbi:MAG: pseudaminic acid synthase [Candidatus Omnitrophica bacterium]|nr:pseudaminic acid synthase [Candidatus Omnitrophota bacterium]
MNINGKKIGDGKPCYIIAEMSANHGGSFQKALSIVREAGKAGANAVKLQTYTADTMTINCKNKYFRIGGKSLWAGKTLYGLYKKAATPWEWHAPLQKEAKKVGLDFFSTPFDETAVDFLASLRVPVYKIASFELVDNLLLEKIAKTRKPIILSTGMASLKEIQTALSILKKKKSGPIALLKCISAYPAKTEEMNLRTIVDLRKKFGVVVGFSDHTVTNTSGVIAVSLGAKIIEKHLKLNDRDKTPDSAFSLNPRQFKNFVDEIRAAESALGQESYGVTAQEKYNIRFRRSIFVVKDISQGRELTEENIRIIRPGFGLSPYFYKDILGKKARKTILRGTPLTRDIIDV